MLNAGLEIKKIMRSTSSGFRMSDGRRSYLDKANLYFTVKEGSIKVLLY